MSATPDYPNLVPKSSSKLASGIDFCGIAGYSYIVRSDLGVYMKCSNFNEGNDIHIYPLRENCRWGDHYLGYQHDGDIFYYIIKGNEYRRVTGFDDDGGGIVYSLHPKCQGGDFYYSHGSCFYIVFLSQGVYRRVTNLHEDNDAIEYSISEELKDGIYFWASNDYVYCLKQPTKWGVSYHKTTNMNTNDNPRTWSVHESVLNFIPGGLATTQGKAFGEWQLIKDFRNSSDTEVNWEKTIKRTVGFEKRVISSIEHNWSIEIGSRVGTKTSLASHILQMEFSLNVQYGGKSVKTSGENWSEATEQTETIKITIPPNSEMHVWQYHMGLGKEKCLFCREIEITNDGNPPQKPPLPVVKEDD